MFKIGDYDMRTGFRRRSGVGLVAACAMAASLTGANAQGSKEEQGSVLGGIFGAIVGNVIPGGGIGSEIARTAAPFVGSAIGASIGAQLDEEDRQALAAATKRAFSSGSSQSVRGKHGSKISVKVAANTKNAAGQQCRTVRQDVILKNGSTLSDTVSACKDGRGWVI